ncbi:MAG: hypothetical protein APG08_00395 [Candidatus Methanofastidiosum methylothiophilum]|uniref:Uncharacterized protein n=1 Tax=Candidatus Methanofastidiosum methylothiophilum TaxID=1705564 RepID=A0A150JKV8_9EURY|nr:MAG: hypothetical protein AN188_00247 [Candidatus Methanofastidiosum methylthiophilus]KYC57114.1 MAG: hypothetical protein APG08_00395 [Candidatus Methanofastidiosum methylthiophilus]KYC57870.1 MAG: hypothetical protein APG09_00754 [Candidatus Methanofastidiosum methylthiophilus]OQC52531.1 MAG: hypothetical protein BWX56_00248 [Euryarchaeota archaeon ADurb.Bin023]
MESHHLRSDLLLAHLPTRDTTKIIYYELASAVIIVSYQMTILKAYITSNIPINLYKYIQYNAMWIVEKYNLHKKEGLYARESLKKTPRHTQETHNASTA